MKPAKPLYVSEQGLINVATAVSKLASEVKNSVLQRERIADIEVRGLQALDADVILMRLKLQKGDPYDGEAVNKEIKNIFDLGYFEDVAISLEETPEGKKLIFDVVEKPRIQAISVLGASEVDEDDILEVINTKTGSVLNPKILADDLERIRELYKKDGFYLADVTYALEGEGKGQARLNIKVAEGKKLYVTKIAIEGAKEISESDLKGELTLSERGIISFLTGKGVLKEGMLDRDAAAIEDYYTNHGFMDARVGQPDVEYAEDGIHVTYKVQEGPRYKVGKVTYSGDLFLPEEELMKVTELEDLREKDEYFNRSVLRDDAERLTSVYNDYGYAYADTSPDLKKNEGELTIDVNYALTKNQKVFVRRVIIEGNTKTRDNVVRREIMLADGDLFCGERLRRSNERLEKLDIFETFDIETVPTGDPKEVDLRVRVKEKATGMLAGGVGYGSYAGVFLTAKLTERNLFGKGYYVGLNAAFSGKETAYELSVTDPRFNDTELEIGADLFMNEFQYPEFDRHTVGGRARMSYPLGEYTRLYWGYRLEQYDIKDVNPFASQEILSSQGRHVLSAVSSSIIRDTTNRRINPTDGSKNSISVLAGGGPLQGTDSFAKAIADTSWYFPLTFMPFKDHVFHVHAQGGILGNPWNNKDVPLAERFYLGGMSSIRGYEGMYVSPRDPATHDLIGGDKELGPLRLEFGYALDQIARQGDKYRLEFAMGQFF